jgi:hypothetical protein
MMGATAGAGLIPVIIGAFSDGVFRIAADDDIGVRMALAPSSDVLRVVVRQGGRLIAGASCWACSRALARDS